ncbi:MAG: dimethyl sulfoxide reductase anchor subunit [Acidobacteriia bacterium]|nr:dimethyl sulfoxide reductase anchor subunit [Terriglobia bacterium]
MKLAFHFDVGRCTGCHACVVACGNQNGESWREVWSFNERREPGLPAYHLSLACNHCEDPACRSSCPASVYSEDPATGAILARTERCLGCRYCAWSCPYDAPRFQAAEGVVRKCDFCIGRLRAGRRPACVAVCPTGALELVERAFVADILISGDRRPPALSPPVEWASRPAMPASVPASAPNVANFGPRSEWPLVVFTAVAPVLVALASAAALSPVAILALGVLALSVAAAHLGRKSRAWRAISNWRTSWLSREVLLFAAFLAAAPVSRPTAALLGFAALFAIDRVYQSALRIPPWRLHSAQATLGGLYLLGLLSGNRPLALAAGAVKLALYLARKIRFYKAAKPTRPWVSLLRVALGFALAPAAWPAAALGDLIDRAEFYEDVAWAFLPGRPLGPSAVLPTSGSAKLEHVTPQLHRR